MSCHSSFLEENIMDQSRSLKANNINLRRLHSPIVKSSVTTFIKEIATYILYSKTGIANYHLMQLMI